MALSITNAELWEAVQKYGGLRPASRAIGVPESTIRTRLKGYTPPLPIHAFVPEAKDMPATHIGEEGVEVRDYWAAQQEKQEIVARYILTSAQNNCRVHPGFLKNLEGLAAHLSAQLLVSFTVYDQQGYRGVVHKGASTRTKHEIWWDQALQPYVTNERCRLHRRLAFCGELDILATTKRPLSGLESYCGRSSLIVPHNRFALQCVESRSHQMPKEMWTTGSVTKQNFVQRKAGQIAHFHHVLGALLVEVTLDGYWYVHHLNAEDDGSFYWLDRRVVDGKVRKNENGLAALILGDIHHEKIDEGQSQIAFDLVRQFQPANILIHDLIDFTSRNHHNRDDPLFRVAMRGVSVEQELRNAARWLSYLRGIALGNLLVVKSNHDQALTRWIKETDWRQDPINAEFYLMLAHLMVMHKNHGDSFDPLQWAMYSFRIGQDLPARFLKLDESFEIAGVECGIHGHVGPSGSRGSPRAFSRLGFKTFTAHTHSPSIVDGCYTVGVLGQLNMGYNVGPNKWMHAHGVIYPNGKRAFLFVKNGRWMA